MPFIQAKLEVSEPDDPLEREADRVADEVMRMPEPRAGMELGHDAPQVQRMCTDCEDELQRQPVEEDEEEMLMPKPASGVAPALTPSSMTTIGSLRGGGEPLTSPLRSFYEPRFGHDFSKVRVHTGARAAQVSRAIGARAFTLGHDIVFGGGELRPHSPSGRQLLAHELTHVVQQGAVPRSSSDDTRLG